MREPNLQHMGQPWPMQQHKWYLAPSESFFYDATHVSSQITVLSNRYSPTFESIRDYFYFYYNPMLALFFF